MSVTTGKKARKYKGTRVAIKRETRHGNPSTYPKKFKRGE